MFEALKKLFNGSKADAGKYADRTILVVDDNELDRRILEKMLEKMGCKVLLAEDGAIGYKLALEHKPDLILSDCRMPNMDGIEMCKSLRANEATKKIPFVFLTGVDSPQNVVECFEVEAENFLCKPINPKLLSSQIKSLLEEHLSA